jgi:tripartite-type tricarboxylate transporter receptor subunit TctC
MQADQAGDRTMIRRRILWAMVAAGVVAATGPARAQGTYPDKLIKMIVPAPAGGQTDVLARLLAQKIQQAVGQNVIIDNRPGAGGARLWRLPILTATPCSTAIPRPWR